MKKLTIFLLVWCFISASAYLALADQIAIAEDGREVMLKGDGTWKYVEKQQSKRSSAFRKAEWGMSKDQVKKIENIKISQENEEMIAYKGELSTFDVLILYVFTKDKLVRGIYGITESHMNKTDHISDYSILKELLNKKYGEPTQDTKHWKKDLYRDDPQEWGLAISVGHLTLFTAWETENTEITMALTGDNFKITHKVQYQSKALGGLEDKAKEEEALDDL